MKNTMKVLALVMALVVVTGVLASCSSISGTYGTDEILGSGATYTFKGSKVTITTKILGFEKSFEGSYKIKDGMITFTFENSEADEYSGEFSFEKGDGYIKIGGVKYNKK